MGVQLPLRNAIKMSSFLILHGWLRFLQDNVIVVVFISLWLIHSISAQQQTTGQSEWTQSCLSAKGTYLVDVVTEYFFSLIKLWHLISKHYVEICLLC